MVKKQEIFCHLFVYLLLHYINGRSVPLVKNPKCIPSFTFSRATQLDWIRVFCRLILFDTHVLCKNI